MLIKSASFARYSKNLCWIVAVIWAAMAVLTFTGGSENAVITGILWLAGAGAFAISAMALGKGSGAGEAAE